MIVAMAAGEDAAAPDSMYERTERPERHWRYRESRLMVATLGQATPTAVLKLRPPVDGLARGTGQTRCPPTLDRHRVRGEAGTPDRPAVGHPCRVVWNDPARPHRDLASR